MKANYFKSVLIIMFAFVSVISFGQAKKITPPNIISPFQMKKVNSQRAIIKPKNNVKKHHHHHVMNLEQEKK